MGENNTGSINEQQLIGRIVPMIQDVLKRWLLIVSAALIAAMGAFVITDMRYQPVYSTTVTFVASAGGTSTTTYSNLNAANSLASVFTQVLNSSLLKQKVLEEVGIDHFDGTIQARAISETNLLTMTVSGSDPRTVFQVSKAIIEYHHIVSDEILGANILEVLQQPHVPTAPTNQSSMKRTVFRAAVAAAVLAVAALAAMSYMSDKVRSRAEADSKLSCRVLGELQHERKYKTLSDMLHRRKKSILISDPITSFSYVESMGKISTRVDKRRHRGERVILVTSLLENEGKSTVAVNLALSMVKKGKRVLLIDCDLRKPACHLILNQSNKGTGVNELLYGQASLEECMLRLRNGLCLIPGKKSLRTASNLMNTPAMSEMLKNAAEKFDFVIVDTPPMSLAPDAECICEFADAALMVIRQNEADAAELEDAIGVLDRSNAHLIGCILNNVYGSGEMAPAFSYKGYGKYGRYGQYSRYGTRDSSGEGDA